MSKKIEVSPLGNTGLDVPPIIYGTSFLGNLYKELPWETKLSIMREWFNASDLPVVVDSAGKYGAGLALEVIGKGLKELGVAPDKVMISNKLGWYRVPLDGPEPTFEKGAWANLKNDAVQKISYDGILECWHQGNDLLGDYNADLVSVHDPDEYLAAASDEKDRSERLDDIKGAYKALFELKEKGLVKAVGIGSKDWHVIKELYSDVKFDWVMIANSLTIYRHPEDILSFIEQLSNDGAGVINSAIFNAGFLTGGEYFDYRLIDPNDPADKERLEWRKRFFAVCDDFGVQPGDACLHFAVSPPQVCSVALNPSKPERIKRNVEVLQTEVPSGFWKALKENDVIDRNYKYL
jgi:D-threo-aldose 1-dehydrogenase